MPGNAESWSAYGKYFSGFVPAPASRAAQAYVEAIEGAGTGQVFSIHQNAGAIKMPLARITLIKGKPPEYLAALSQAVHASLVEAYDMDDGDRFQIIEEIEPGRLIYSLDYAGGPRSENFVLVGIESMPRSKEMKEAFYKHLVRRLAEAPGVRSEDIFICLSDRLALEDFSFANGISAAELAARYGRSK